MPNKENNEAPNTSSGASRKQQEQNATKETLKTAAKGAGTYFGGPVGNAVVDKVANSKLGDKVLDKASKKINQVPGVGKAAKKLDDSGSLKAANLAMNTMGGKGANTTTDPNVQQALQKVDQNRMSPSMNALGATPLGAKSKGEQSSTVEGEEESASSQIFNKMKPGKKKSSSKSGADSDQQAEIKGESSFDGFVSLLKKVPGWLWPILVAFLMMIIVSFAVLVLQLAPLFAVHGLLNMASEAFTSFTEQIGNIFSFGSDIEVKNEKEYFKATEEKQTFYEQYAGNPTVDMDLVTATLFYAKFGGEDFSESNTIDGNKAKKSIDTVSKLMIVAEEHLYVGCAESSSVAYEPSKDDNEAIAANKRDWEIGKVSTLTAEHTVAYSYDEDGNPVCNLPEDWHEFKVDTEREGIFWYNILNGDFLDDYYKKYLDANSENYDKSKWSLVDGIFTYYGIVKEDTGGSGVSYRHYGATCSFNVGSQEASDIKVRLLQCGDGSRGQPIAGEDLVDFEKYILGVVYAENGGGPTEALKTQAVAARTYALTRGKQMGGAANIGLTYESGQWILSIRNCTEDQVYCDPDKGCWSNSSSAGGTVHSGSDSSKSYSRGPLAADSSVRSAVASVAGEVVVDASGNLVVTPYTAETQRAWNSDAQNGMGYFSIIQKYYGDKGASDLKSNCVLSGGGDYTSWKQGDSAWGNILLGSNGSSSMANIGCMVTSYAIMIAKSGTMVTIDNFNPGTFAQAMKASGAFTPGGAFTSSNYKLVAPNLTQVTGLDISGSQEEKFNQIKKYADMGYEMVIRAKCVGLYCSSGQHWVAFDHIEGNKVYVFDPSFGKSGLLWPTYDYRYTNRINVFKRED